MKIFDIFSKFRKKNNLEPEISRGAPLPEDLERFRIRSGPTPLPEPAQPAPYRAPPEERVPTMPSRPMLPEAAPKTEFDKLDMVLEKLETIDARLRLIEERLRK